MRRTMLYQLYELIQNLTPSEKSYFSRQVGDNDQDFMQLYELLKKMKSYDEDKVKNKLKKLNRTSISFCYDRILKEMRSYHENNSKSIKLKQYLIDTVFLFERGLFIDCHKRLEEAKEIAEEIDDQIALLEIHKYTRYLYRKVPELLQEILKEPKELSGLKKEKADILHAINHELEYFDYADDIFAYVSKSVSEQQQTLELPSEDRFKPVLMPTLPRGKRNFLQAASYYYLFTKKREEAYHCLSDLMLFWKDHSNLKEEFFSWYITDFGNFMFTCTMKEDFERILVELDQLEAVKLKDEQLKAIQFQKLYTLKIQYYMNRAEPDVVNRFLPFVEKKEKSYPIKLNGRFALYYNIMTFYFLSGGFGNDLERWIEKLISLMPDAKTRIDIQKITLVFKALYLHEQGIKLSGNKSFRSIKENLLTWYSGNNELEVKLVEHVVALNENIIDNKGKGVQEVRRKLLDTLKEEIERNKEGRVPVGIEELAIWAESRIKGVSMWSVMQKDLAKT